MRPDGEEVVLSVYRGSVSRKGARAGKVKTSILMAAPLATVLTARIHVLALKLCRVNPTKGRH